MVSSTPHIVKGHLKGLNFPQLWDARWEGGYWQEGAAPHTEMLISFLILIRICTHLPGLSLPWQQKLRVSGLVEQRVSWAWFPNSQTRPEAALAHEVEKFMLAVLNGFQNIKVHEFFLGKSQRWSLRGGPSWGVDFLRGVGISKTIKSLNPLPLKVEHVNSVHFPQTKKCGKPGQQYPSRTQKRQAL